MTKFSQFEMGNLEVLRDDLLAIFPPDGRKLTPRELLHLGTCQIEIVLRFLDKFREFKGSLEPLEFLFKETLNFYEGRRSALLDEATRNAGRKAPAHGYDVKEAQMWAALALEAAVQLKVNKTRTAEKIASILNKSEIRMRVGKPVTGRAVAEWREQYRKAPNSQALSGEMFAKSIAAQKRRGDWPQTEAQLTAYIRGLPQRIKG